MTRVPVAGRGQGLLAEPSELARVGPRQGAAVSVTSALSWQRPGRAVRGHSAHRLDRDVDRFSTIQEDIAMTSAALILAMSVSGLGHHKAEALPSAQAPSKVAPAPQAPCKVAPAPAGCPEPPPGPGQVGPGPRRPAPAGAGQGGPGPRPPGPGPSRPRPRRPGPQAPPAGPGPGPAPRPRPSRPPRPRRPPPGPAQVGAGPGARSPGPGQGRPGPGARPPGPAQGRSGPGPRAGPGQELGDGINRRPRSSRRRCRATRRRSGTVGHMRRRPPETGAVAVFMARESDAGGEDTDPPRVNP